MTIEKLCYRCNPHRNYKNSKGHVRKHHSKDAFDTFANKNMSQLPNDLMCHICKTFVEDPPRKHVALVHSGRAYDEFARTLDEEVMS